MWDKDFLIRFFLSHTHDTLNISSFTQYRFVYMLFADIDFGIALDSNIPRLLSLGQDRVLVCTAQHSPLFGVLLFVNVSYTQFQRYWSVYFLSLVNNKYEATTTCKIVETIFQKLHFFSWQKIPRWKNNLQFYSTSMCKDCLNSLKTIAAVALIEI